MPPTQNQPPQIPAASLPPLRVNAVQQQTVPAQPAAAPVATSASSVAAQAKLLVEQYKANPYQLTIALQQLKGKYLSEHFGITPNQGDK